MMENVISFSSLYSFGFIFNYLQVVMMGFMGSYGSLLDLQQLGYVSYSGIFNIIFIVIGEFFFSFFKELISFLVGVGDVSFDFDSQFFLDEFKIDFLIFDGLYMFNDFDMVLVDLVIEDIFWMDCL